MIVVDASVFVKLFRDEDDSSQARELFSRHLSEENGLAAPSILLYEALATALHYEQPFTKVVQLLAQLRTAGFDLMEPDLGEIAKAEEIARTPSPIGGYATLSDSIYHAVAICRGGIFVTADKRHLAKTKQFGSIVLLADWRPA